MNADTFPIRGTDNYGKIYWTNPHFAANHNKVKTAANVS